MILLHIYLFTPQTLRKGEPQCNCFYVTKVIILMTIKKLTTFTITLLKYVTTCHMILKFVGYFI